MDVRIEMMLKKNYIYALVLSSALAVTLMGCRKQVILADDGGKTAVEFSVDMPMAAEARTKAYDVTFEKNDVILTYLQHMNNEAVVEGTSGKFSRLCQINVNSTSSTASNAINNWDGPNYKLVTTNMYWDDFMSGDPGKDIRDTGHGLRSFYALCYNGRTPSPALAEATGVLDWSVAADQSSGIKTSDLLYSGTQAKVAYQHSITSALNGQHGVIHLPFNHAMSKVTIEVEGDESFNNSASIFDATQIILQDVNTVCKVTTPTQALSAYGKGSGDGKVTMQPVSPFFAKRRSFTAVIAPSLIKGGDAVFAKLMNVGGYNFELKLSDAVINPFVDGNPKPGSWAGKLAAYNATEVTPSTAKGYTAENGGLTIPGVNYYIKVTVHRQGIEVSAQILPWENVNAEGAATALFEGDIKTTGEITNDLKAGGFDMYASTDPASFGSVASTVTWVDEEDPTPDHWQYSPQLYWPSGTYNSYFRALAPSGATTTLTSHDKPAEGADVQDVLWGTTSAHSGTDESGNSYNFAEGDPIRPRTGKVPMTFYHAMAKISVNLVDAHKDDPAPDPENPYADSRLDLRGATLALYNLASTGTLGLNVANVIPGGKGTLLTGYYAANDDSITPSETQKKLAEYFVVPQSMKAAEDPSVADPYLEITLADGTTKYKIYLRNVLVQKAEGDPEYVDSWEKNKHYEYTITLSKEEITFRALVKDWDVKNGSGIADLEWD